MIFWAIVAAAVVGLALLIKKMSGLRAVVDAARADFQAQVGYEYASALRLNPAPTRQKQTAAGLLVHHFEVYSERNRRVTVQSWTLSSKTAPPATFQLIDAKLVGLAQKLFNLSSIKRVLTIAFPGPHSIGDPLLDARFKLYAPDPDRARSVLQRPEVQRALLDLAQVSLIVDDQGATFGDPTDANVYAMGASRTDFSPVPAVNAATKVHLAIAALLTLVVQARSG